MEPLYQWDQWQIQGGDRGVYPPTIGVGPTRPPGIGRGAERACPALPGTFPKSYNRVEESNGAPGQPGHLLHFVAINSGVATVIAIDWATPE